MVYCEMDQPWALINPEIVDIGNEDFEVWDDCFSFPNLLVPRLAGPYRVRVRYQDTKGEWHEVDLEGDRAGAAPTRDRPSRRRPWRWTVRTGSIRTACGRSGNRLYGPNRRYGPPEDRSTSYATPLHGAALRRVRSEGPFFPLARAIPRQGPLASARDDDGVKVVATT